jgi:ubiquinone/menaquinone biosynthesis C-methylase UbiE
MSHTCRFTSWAARNTQRPEHNEAVRREFTRQAAGIDQPGSVLADVAVLEWIESEIDAPVDGRILDVAGGTGQLGRHLAVAGRAVTVVDLTDAMLAAGVRAAIRHGQHNVVFVRGDASALPFPDGQFDAVVCRFALHHMERPAQAIIEMARVCRSDGTVTLIDMVSGGGRHDELERLRDPSHTRALTEHELAEMLATAGRKPRRFAGRTQRMDADAWLDRAQPGEPERRTIITALSAEADGGPPTGLSAARTPSGLDITQCWVLVGG